MGLLGVFLLLSFQFRSYVEPVIVMLAIPFALIGVIWGHAAMGLPLTIPSMFGFVIVGLVKSDAECIYGLFDLCLHECDDECRVDPAGEAADGPTAADLLAVPAATAFDGGASVRVAQARASSEVNGKVHARGHQFSWPAGVRSEPRAASC